MKVDFRQILSFMPLIIQAISFAETLKNGTANGWEKKDAALMLVREVAGAFRFPWDAGTDEAIDAAIDASVAVMHKLGVFKREEEHENERETALEFGIFARPNPTGLRDEDARAEAEEPTILYARVGGDETRYSRGGELEREAVESERERQQITADNPDARLREHKLQEENIRSEAKRKAIRDRTR
jgi:hypothetical protein